MVSRRSLAVFSVAVLLAASYAYACSCSGHPTTEDEARAWIDESDVVALVRIDEHVQRSWAEGNDVAYDSYFSGVVVEGYKGVNSGAGIYLQTKYDVSCAVVYRPTDTYLVFGSGPKADGRIHTTLCRSFSYETTLEAGPAHHQLLKDNLSVILRVLRSHSE